jgi:hypothetical protein
MLLHKQFKIQHLKTYASDDEQLIEKEIEEDEEELQHDMSEEQHAYEILIE